MKKTEQQIRESTEMLKREIPVAYLMEQDGFTIVQKGRTLTTKEHDSIVIKPEENYFFWNSKKGQPNWSGSVVDYVMLTKQCTAREAYAELMSIYRESGKSFPFSVKQHTEQKPEAIPDVFTLPQKDSHNRNVFSYLTKTRGIESELVQELFHKKLLYQDQHKNCVFVTYDKEKPVFATVRGTNTEKPFQQDVKHSDYRFGFVLDYGSKDWIVTESAIDALSLASYLPKVGADKEKFNYLGLAGVGKTKALFELIENKKVDTIFLAFDNDTAGREATGKLMLELKEQSFTGNVRSMLPPNHKDRNEELQAYHRERTAENEIER